MAVVPYLIQSTASEKDVGTSLSLEMGRENVIMNFYVDRVTDWSLLQAENRILEVRV